MQDSNRHVVGACVTKVASHDAGLQSSRVFTSSRVFASSTKTMRVSRTSTGTSPRAGCKVMIGVASGFVVLTLTRVDERANGGGDVRFQGAKVRIDKGDRKRVSCSVLERFVRSRH